MNSLAESVTFQIAYDNSDNDAIAGRHDIRGGVQTGREEQLRREEVRGVPASDEGLHRVQLQDD